MSEELRDLIEQVADQAADEYGLSDEEAYEVKDLITKVVEGEITKSG
jgi:hypothetical protein